MRLTGSIQINRYSPGDEFHIVITDAGSGCVAVDATLTPHQLAMALSGMSIHKEIEFDFNDSGVIGTTTEHKTEIVPGNTHLLRREERLAWARETLHEVESDGWRGDVSDLLNPHCAVEGGHRVNFHRYVRDGKVVEIDRS